MTQTVIGLFSNSSDAENASQELMNKGFSRSNVDVSYSNDSMDTGTTSINTSTTNGDISAHEGETGISKFFKNLFGDNHEDADRYSNAASKSSVVITVHAQSAEEAEKAADILDDNGATNIDEGTSEKETVYGTAPVVGATTGSTMKGYKDDAAQSIKVIEEKLEVGKRDVQTGGVRLRSRIVERPVEESLRLRQEKVNVMRNTVNRPATDADFTAFKEGTVEMVETAEVPVVSKQARVVEEISLGKEVTQKEETIRDTVRKTEVDIEDIKGNNDSFMNKTKSN